MQKRIMKGNDSPGTADYDPEIDHSVIEIVRRADREMYRNSKIRMDTDQEPEGRPDDE